MIRLISFVVWEIGIGSPWQQNRAARKYKGKCRCKRESDSKLHYHNNCWHTSVACKNCIGQDPFKLIHVEVWPTPKYSAQYDGDSNSLLVFATQAFIASNCSQLLNHDYISIVFGSF